MGMAGSASLQSSPRPQSVNRIDVSPIAWRVSGKSEQKLANTRIVILVPVPERFLSDVHERFEGVPKNCNGRGLRLHGMVVQLLRAARRAFKRLYELALAVRAFV